MGRGVTFVVVLYAVSQSASAISPGQVDTFQNGTFLNWGGNASPTNVATNGPAGVGDRYLRISSTGGGLATRNSLQWAGDYLSTGITALGMDLRNEGSAALNMRIALFNSPGGDFTTATALTLPADNTWHHFVFGLSAADLAYTGGGTGLLSDTLSNMGLLLIRHQSGAPLGSGATTGVVGTVGIDNVVAIPEPRSFLLMAVCCVAITLGRMTPGTTPAAVRR